MGSNSWPPDQELLTFLTELARPPQLLQFVDSLIEVSLTHEGLHTSTGHDYTLATPIHPWNHHPGQDGGHTRHPQAPPAPPNFPAPPPPSHPGEPLVCFHH